MTARDGLSHERRTAIPLTADFSPFLSWNWRASTRRQRLHWTLTTRSRPADAQCSYWRSRARRDGWNGFQAQYALHACVATKE